MGSRMKNILGVHWKTWFLGGGFIKTNKQPRGDYLKRGGLVQFANLKGAWQERGWVFLRRVDIPMHMREQQVKWIFEKLQLTVVLRGEITMKKIRFLIDFHDFCKTFLLIWLVSGKNFGQKCYFHESRSVPTFQAN